MAAGVSGVGGAGGAAALGGDAAADFQAAAAGAGGAGPAGTGARIQQIETQTAQDVSQNARASALLSQKTNESLADSNRIKKTAEVALQNLSQQMQSLTQNAKLA